MSPSLAAPGQALRSGYLFRTLAALSAAFKHGVHIPTDELQRAWAGVSALDSSVIYHDHTPAPLAKLAN